MAKCELLEGLRTVRKIYWPGEDGESCKVGKEFHSVKSIKVVRVAGQGGYVPWFEVVGHDGGVALWNAAHVAGVEFVEDDRR